MLFQPPIPARYLDIGDQEIADRVEQHRRQFGERLVILGHHYQQDEVIRFADFTGDSLKLAQIAARQSAAQYVVFCGVHFMAESADILTDEGVAVILPDLSAGCSMADMAEIEQLEDAWEVLTAATAQPIVPITYVNSTAAVKAFCGRHGGACCTSSNARLVLEWALRQGGKVLFLPDQHLGRNSAYALDIPLADMAVYDPAEPDGGLDADRVRQARVLLWKGHCSVHQLFTPQQCDRVRQEDPECRILVHPECAWEVVQKADYAGSTEYILKTVRDAGPGTRWAVGTEIHLVNRLAARETDKVIRSLAPVQCLCTTMYRISPRHLLWALDQLADGQVVNRIQVPPHIRQGALLALDRMLANVSAQPVSAK